MTALLDSSRKSCQTSPHREKPTSFSFKGKQNHLGEADKSKVGRREETGELRDGKLQPSYSTMAGYLLGNHSASPRGGEHRDSMDLSTAMS